MAQSVKTSGVSSAVRHPIQLLSRGNQTPAALAKMAGSKKGAAAACEEQSVAAAAPANQLQLAAAGGAAAEQIQVECLSPNDEDPLANTKEKTPMCLINELARFNKIQHQYTLTDEQGPAHKKTFYVKLKLGEEQYAASGPSIKKAQHAAAKEALAESTLKHPPPKAAPANGLVVCSNPSITPTVELNALAMKRGEPAVYRPIEPNRPSYFPPPNLDFRGMYHQRYHYPKYPPRIFYVSLKVGHREFIGEGSTRQAARHSAAEKALKVLKCLPMPGEAPLKKGLDSSSEDDSDDDEDNNEEEEKTDQTDDNGAVVACDDNEDDALKSEISLVHEIALRRSLTVNFEVIKESGPPHMRTFVTRCTCGSFVSDGVGNSKKLSKKRCAEKMLEELRTLPALPPLVNKVRKMPVNKKKNRNLIKIQKASVDYGVGINPISRLIQIQQAKKEKEPVYSLLAERGLPRRREFVIQVSVGEQSCTGVGPNKKLAKRTAAEQMLQLLGYSRPSPQPQKPAIKTADSASSGATDKKVTFQDLDNNPSPNIMARQLMPGVLVLPDSLKLASGSPSSAGAGPGAPFLASQVTSANGFTGENFAQTTAVIAKELLEHGVSPTAEALKKTVEASVGTGGPLSSVHQKRLEYLGKVLGFTVEYSYFFKGVQGGKQEYLSLVSLSTNPPRVYHGSGPDVESSHNMAALNALRELSEIDLDRVQQNGTENASEPSSDTKGTVEQAPI